MQDLSNKKVLVIGAGLSGRAAAIFLATKGAKVTLTDNKTAADLDGLADLSEKNGVRLLLGGMPEGEAVEDYQLAVISPGIPLDNPTALSVQQAGVPLLGELELAYQFSHNPFLAITGTNGKTTTTSLLGYILEQSGKQCIIGGNIGKPLVNTVEDLPPDACVVAELSSFQLETAQEFKAHIGAFLNLTPDHLYRHGDMANYGAIKAKIFAHQTPADFAVLNYDDELVRAWAPKLGGTVVFFSRQVDLSEGMLAQNGRLLWRWQGREVDIMPADEVLIKGPHNLENALAAAAMALLAGVEPRQVRLALQSFPGVEHRQERVGEFGGVLYVNDSKGTNPDSTIMALRACTRPTVLILGGYEKNSDFSSLLPLIKKKVKHIVLMGQTAERIAETLQAGGFKAYESAGMDFERCVQLAAAAAEPGDEVLLSPASASWGMFNNFEERGECFKQLVHKLGNL